MKQLYMILPLALILCFMVGCQDKEAMAELEQFKAQAALEEQNLALVKQQTDAWNKLDFNAVRENVSPEYRLYTPSNITKPYSIEEEIRWLKMMEKAFPDLNLNIEEIFAKGDKVVLRYVSRGTQSGEFEGIPATGKQIEFGGIIIFRIENGKIVETREDYDYCDFMQQLGMELKPKEGEK